MSTPNPAAAAAPAAGKSKKMMVIGALVLVILAVAGYLFMNKQRADAEEAQASATPAVPTFLPLENMVVNLADSGGERFAQIGITLELQDEKTATAVKQFMPSIRNGVLMLVSQRSSDELLQREGKEKLAADILLEVSRPLGFRPQRKPQVDDDYEEDDRPRRRNPVRRVLFSSFIIQ